MVEQSFFISVLKCKDDPQEAGLFIQRKWNESLIAGSVATYSCDESYLWVQK